MKSEMFGVMTFMIFLSTLETVTNIHQVKQLTICLLDLEIIMEPMTRVKVNGITEQGEFKIVQVEPVKGEKLLFEDEIPPGCIQHIILALSKDGKESRELCDKMCSILCRINLNDSASRKQTQTKDLFMDLNS